MPPELRPPNSDEHEHPGEPPKRPRMCSTCGRPRDVEAPAGDGELVCAQVPRRQQRRPRLPRDVVPDYAVEGEEPDAPELLAWCGECWQREFA